MIASSCFLVSDLVAILAPYRFLLAMRVLAQNVVQTCARNDLREYLQPDSPWDGTNGTPYNCRHSPNLNTEMALVAYGHDGPRCSCSDGRGRLSRV